jgi:glycerate kinase
VDATGGQIRRVPATGPTENPISSYYGILGDEPKTAVVEIAAAAGLSLVTPDCRNPCITTTFGVGQLIAAALEEDVGRIIVDVVILGRVMAVQACFKPSEQD